MPRDSNGNYSLPNGYQAIPGATILASQHNPPLEDLAQAITDSLPRSGVAPMTGQLPLIDGTPSAPGLAFANERGLGFYRAGTGLIGVSGTINGLVPVGLGPVPWSGLTAPSGWVLCFGQTLSRTAYPALWSFAQAEIAAGNTFYNNGDGSTTFGIGDGRGRVVAGKDNMGGTAAGRLTSAGSGINGSTLGAAGGSETVALLLAHIANHDHAIYLNDPGHNHALTVPAGTDAQIQQGTSTLQGWHHTTPGTVQIAGTNVTLWSGAGGTGNQNKTAASGSGQAHQNCQPTIVSNFILYAGV